MISIFFAMRRTYFLIFCLFLLTSVRVSAQDYILLPENFYLHKDDKLNLHLITATQFVKQDELKFETSKTAKFMLEAGSKKINLMTVARDSASPLISYPLIYDGLNTISMVRKPVTDEVERDDFLKILEDAGMTKELEKAKNGSKDSFREKYALYMKTLVQVDKYSANGFDKPLNDDFEITLKDNPYKGNYGDDIIAQIRLRGKLMVDVVMVLYVKTATGSTVFAQKLSSDKQGQVYFKLSREGIYLLQATHMEPSKDKNADFETWTATYSFAFNSSNEMPNTYKEFGFGDKH
jgi:hypothetical protein